MRTWPGCSHAGRRRSSASRLQSRQKLALNHQPPKRLRGWPLRVFCLHTHTMSLRPGSTLRERCDRSISRHGSSAVLLNSWGIDVRLGGRVQIRTTRSSNVVLACHPCCDVQCEAACTLQTTVATQGTLRQDAYGLLSATKASTQRWLTSASVAAQELALAHASGQQPLRVAVLCEKGRALQLMGLCAAQLQAQSKAVDLCCANVAGPDGCGLQHLYRLCNSVRQWDLTRPQAALASFQYNASCRPVCSAIDFTSGNRALLADRSACYHPRCVALRVEREPMACSEALAAALPHLWLRLADAHTTDGNSDEGLRCAEEGARAAAACGNLHSQVCVRS